MVIWVSRVRRISLAQPIVENRHSIGRPDRAGRPANTKQKHRKNKEKQHHTKAKPRTNRGKRKRRSIHTMWCAGMVFQLDPLESSRFQRLCPRQLHPMVEWMHATTNSNHALYVQQHRRVADNSTQRRVPNGSMMCGMRKKDHDANVSICLFSLVTLCPSYLFSSCLVVSCLASPANCSASSSILSNNLPARSFGSSIETSLYLTEL